MTSKDSKDNKENGVELGNIEQIQPNTTQKVELMDFEKAFRIFKKTNAKAQKWDSEAVLVFVKKKNSNKLNSLNSWVEVFNKY